MEAKTKRNQVYFKTWTVEQNKYPPNGGSGGYGYAKDLYFKNLTVEV
ncbi:hypothetical protein SUNI508_04936 [Seiridium unicorne]|uniref:Uncharacterized protein n=1 Tax=Seiridium unicorne TaxID=138068 RepID=A0ABR2V5R9_9PEZI